MREHENRLDQLFESARTEEPVRSFASSKSAFLAGIGTSDSTGLLAKWANLSFTFKTLIMVGFIGTVATVATICVMNTGGSNESLNSNEIVIPKQEQTEVLDTQNEVIVQTTFLDENKDWVEISISPTKEDERDTAWMDILEDLKRPEPIGVDIDRSESIPPRIEDDTTATEEKTTLHSFIIEKNSSDEDLETIRKLACAAGMKFNYNAIMWRGKIKRLGLHVRIDKPNGGYCKHNSTATGKFKFRIQWVENEDGVATDFWIEKIK